MTRKTVLLTGVTALAALLLGVGMGSASTSTGPVQQVQSVPESCRTALDLADQGFGIAAGAFAADAEAFTAAGKFDTAGVDAAGVKIKDANSQLGALGPQYNAAKTECRSH